MKYVIILAMLLASNTQALEIDLGLGYTWTEKPPNTLWYQEEFDHDIKSNDTNYQIGLRFNPWDNIYLTAGYKYLGKFTVSSDFIANDDVYYSWQAGGVRPKLSHLTGSGTVQGMYFKGEYHFSSGFFLTGGWWAHKAEWSVISPEEYGLNAKGETYGPYVMQHENNAGYTISWIAGAGYKYGQWSVLAEIWDIENGGEKSLPSTYIGNSQVVTLLYTF